MQFPRTPLFIVWTNAVAIAALYLVVRLFVAEYEKLDYMLMVFVHGSLVIQYLMGWRHYRKEQAPA